LIDTPAPTNTTLPLPPTEENRGKLEEHLLHTYINTCEHQPLPQGYIASGDGYTSRYNTIVSHISTKTKCIDDALLWSQDIAGAYTQVVEWLDVCGRNGITLNSDKFRFAKDAVEFAGFEITPTTIKPSRKYHRCTFWFGLVDQMS
jgi:hypothetical protein